MNREPQTFSVVFSIRAFLVDLCQQHFGGLPLFLNSLIRPHEKEQMLSLERYLVIDVTQGEPHWKQPLDVSFHLFATSQADPTTLWLQRTPQYIIDRCLEARTDTDSNMIALMDYDALLGETDIKHFYLTGQLPGRLLQIAQQRSPHVPPLRYQGMRVGLRVNPSRYAVRLERHQVPMSATWSMTFLYFEPRRQGF